ncbi:MAG: hypothetical protein Kow0047_27300 [Anaerolineae bacterium]
MSPRKDMSFKERRSYLLKMQQRYREASRKEKARLLDEMVAVTGMHRKSLIRLLNSEFTAERKPRRRERGPGRKTSPQT